MDLEYTPEELAFRAEVRGFLQGNLPQDIRDKVVNFKRLHKEDYVRWQKILYQQGYFPPAWPKEFGGPGWSPFQLNIFDEECSYAGAPELIPFGAKMVAPVIMKFGTQAQQERFLPRIRASEDWWCQGYSEPGSGSDLASLKTSAVREGDDYLVNGQKTWTTQGQYADWMFCLVRTSRTGKPQEGISFLLLDMKSPGITVRPIATMDGEHHVNEVFLDNVRVPVENLVGEEGKGWTCAKYLLGHERTGITRVGQSKRQLKYVKYLAQQERTNGKPLLDDPLFRAKVVQAEAELMALEFTVLRVLTGTPGPEASMLKIRGSELSQAVTELLVEAIGPYALPYRHEAFEAAWAGEPVGPVYAAPLAAYYCNMRKTTIYGGSSEVQKNIIAKMMLGL